MYRQSRDYGDWRTTERQFARSPSVVLPVEFRIRRKKEGGSGAIPPALVIENDPRDPWWKRLLYHLAASLAGPGPIFGPIYRSHHQGDQERSWINHPSNNPD